MRLARSKTLALAVAVGAAIGVGGASTAQAAPPAADGSWCAPDQSGVGFTDFTFSDRSFRASLFNRSALTGRLPFGRQFLQLPRAFNFGGPRALGAPGQFPIGRRFGVPGQFGAPGDDGYGGPGAGQVGGAPGRGRGADYGMPGRGRARGGPGAGQVGAPGGQSGGYGSPG